MNAPRTGTRQHPAIILIATALVLAAASPSTAQQDQAPQQIPRIDSRITVDGVLDESVWERAWSTTLDHEVRPGENTPAPVETEVLVYHDQQRLYVGFRAFDPDPSSIRAHLSDRDQSWADDGVGVVLDTFNDERRNYLLTVNPLGVQSDTIEIEAGGNTPWDGIWASAATITEWGWAAEMEIPFSTLRFQRSDRPQIWGFDAIRGYPRNVPHQMGAFPRDRSNNCYLCQALKIEGFAGVSPGRNIEIVPTLVATRTDERDELPDGPMVDGDPEAEIGLTARWGLTPNLTFSGTINPDFSQVEADALQLQVNRPFAIFFPELRPFFMEGADFFETPLQVVYTRVMREPSWGLKLTGKEGPHTMGAYVVDDEITNLIIPGSESSDFEVLDQSNLSTVLRYRYDVGNRFTLGGIFTNREGDHYLNRVAGVDGDLRLTRRDRVFIQLLGSSTRYPTEIVDEYGQPEGTFDDWAAEIYYSHQTRTWLWWAVLRDIGTDFRADLGFMPQVDNQHREAGIGYQWNQTANSWYSRMDIKAKVADTVDQTGFLLFHEDVIQWTVEGPIQSHSVIRPSRVREGFNGEQFEFNRLRLHFCAKPNGHSHVWLNLSFGGQVDYANTRPGEFVNFDGGFWYRLGRHFFIEPKYTRERMEVDEGWLYTSSIAQLQTSWQFNPRCFIRAILQYVDNEFNSGLYSDGRDPEQRQFFSQLLFSYKLNPRTVFFLGYSDNSRANQDYGLTQSDWTLFAKIGYAWVL
jgi:hypothetical protein